MPTQAALLLQDDGGRIASGLFVVLVLLALAIAVIFIGGMWKTYTKAGKPGWAVLVPFYNLYVMLQIAGKPGWWLALYFIPFVNIVITIMVAIGLARAFGRSTAFGVVMLFFLAGIGYLILGYGDSRYVGPPAAA